MVLAGRRRVVSMPRVLVSRFPAFYSVRFGALVAMSDPLAEGETDSRYDSATIAGQAVYTAKNLESYDFIVLQVSNSWIWRCPTRRLLQHYNDRVSGNHLDVGVGTGYFLDRCRFPVEQPRVVLMDLNRNSLEYARNRISRLQPEICVCNVLEPIAWSGPKFDSIGLNYLLHCLPGQIGNGSAGEIDKAVVFDHLAALANPGATVFGSTLVQDGVRRGWAARKLMAFYNSKGIFSNRHDTLSGLRAELERRLDNVAVDVVGCGVLFSGTVR